MSVLLKSKEFFAARQPECWRREEASQRASGGSVRKWHRKATQKMEEISTSYEVAPRIDRSGTLHPRRKSVQSSSSGSAELLRATTHSPHAPLGNLEAEDINLRKVGTIFS